MLGVGAALFGILAAATPPPADTRQSTDSGPGTSFREVAAAVGVAHPGRGRNAAWCDLDVDGRLDLVTGSMQARDVLYRNLGGRAFADTTDVAGLGSQHSGYAHVCGDYDNDGHLDLFVSRGGFQELRLGRDPDSLYRSNGDGTFSEVSFEVGINDLSQGFGAAWLDHDLDGFLDLVVANLGEPNFLYRNRGDGTFVEIGAAAGVADRGGAHGLAVADHDGDGAPDVFIANKSVVEGRVERNVLYENRGDGTFEDVADLAGVAGEGGGFCTVMADFDNDGRTDIFVGSFNHFREGRFATLNGAPGIRHALFRNLGNGRFEDVAVEFGLDHVGGSMGVAAGDYDRDGFLDLYVVHGGPEEGRPAEPDILFRNRAGSRFERASEATGAENRGQGHGPAFGDYDADGDLDLYVPNGGFDASAAKSNLLFENLGNRNHWLTLELRGRAVNRSAIGARVRVVTGELEQTREVSGGSGFGAQDSLPLEFGLARHHRIDELEIRWPGGGTTRLRDLAADRFLQVHEDGTVLEARAGRNRDGGEI